MNALTAADYADTGQWRLILKIFGDGMEAYLENTLHEDVGQQRLFSVNWDADESTLRGNVENAVYDNPRVLDDFSTKIILYDRKTIFSPSELVEENGVEGFHTAVYPCEPVDIMSDVDDDVTATYSMAPGLKSFLYRTFPGSRIYSHLMDMFISHRNNGEGMRMYVEIRKTEADILLVNGRNLISAATHTWRDHADVVYFILNTLSVYGVPYNDVDLYISGERLSTDISSKLKKQLHSVERI